jgi:hypothetical protein
VDKITVVCHKDHDKGYEDYVGKCLLCEVERLQKREWVGLTVDEARKFYEKYTDREELIYAIDKFLEDKNA